MTFRQQAALWVPLARPFTLTASAAPVAVGAALAAWDSAFAWDRFLALLLAAVLIQAATNMLNEYFDYARGVDTHESVGIAGTIVHGHLPAGTVLRGALLTLTIALLLGLYLVAVAGLWLLAAGAASGLAAWLYSGGPKPVSSTPFGELEVFVFMGLLLVGAGYFVHAEALRGGVLLASLPVACLVAAILLGNNIRDMAGDAARGRHTLPIVFGRRAALLLLVALVYGAFACMLAAAAVGAVPNEALLAFAAIPLAPGIFRRFGSTTVPAQLHPAVKGIARLHLLGCGLYAAGIAAALL